MKRILCVWLVFIVVFSLNVPALAIDDIDVNAESAILVEVGTNKILYAKNEREKVYPASVTKVMTALLTIENADLDEVVTVQANADDGLSIYGSAVTPALVTGEELTVRELLECLLIASDNKAANVLAEYIGGSLDGFVAMMNARAAQLGCQCSHFVNPHGLHDDNHYTCAYDVFLIAREAATHKDFMDICNSESMEIGPTNMTEETRYSYTTNYLISTLKNPDYYYSKARGIKTGHTTPAGHCLVSMAEENGLQVISVIMGAPVDEETGEIYSFSETKRLLEWGLTSFENKTLIQSGVSVAECPVRLAQDTDYVMLKTMGSISDIVPVDFDTALLQQNIVLSSDEGVDAPITKGEVLGEITVSYQGTVYGTLPLVAADAVERSETLYIADQVRYILTLKWVRSIIIIVILLVLAFTFFMIWHNMRRKKSGEHFDRYGSNPYRGSRKKRR